MKCGRCDADAVVDTHNLRRGESMALCSGHWISWVLRILLDSGLPIREACVVYARENPAFTGSAPRSGVRVDDPPLSPSLTREAHDA